MKDKDNEKLILNARLVIHGDRGVEKDLLRTDSAAADMKMTSIVVSLAVIMVIDISPTDIKGAFMQSGPICREEYALPPRELSVRGIIWKLTELPCGMVEAGRQWLKTVEKCMGERSNLKAIPQFGQIFLKRDEAKKFVLMIAKTFDDFLIAGSESDIDDFITDLKERFNLGSI